MRARHERLRAPQVHVLAVFSSSWFHVISGYFLVISALSYCLTQPPGALSLANAAFQATRLVSLSTVAYTLGSLQLPLVLLAILICGRFALLFFHKSQKRSTQHPDLPDHLMLKGHSVTLGLHRTLKFLVVGLASFLLMDLVGTYIFGDEWLVFLQGRVGDLYVRSGILVASGIIVVIFQRSLVMRPRHLSELTRHSLRSLIISEQHDSISVPAILESSDKIVAQVASEVYFYTSEPCLRSLYLGLRSGNHWERNKAEWVAEQMMQAATLGKYKAYLKYLLVCPSLLRSVLETWQPTQLRIMSSPRIHDARERLLYWIANALAVPILLALIGDFTGIPV